MRKFLSATVIFGCMVLFSGTINAQEKPAATADAADAEQQWQRNCQTQLHHLSVCLFKIIQILVLGNTMVQEIL